MGTRFNTLGRKRNVTLSDAVHADNDIGWQFLVNGWLGPEHSWLDHERWCWFMATIYKRAKVTSFFFSLYLVNICNSGLRNYDSIHKQKWQTGNYYSCQSCPYFFCAHPQMSNGCIMSWFAAGLWYLSLLVRLYPSSTWLIFKIKFVFQFLIPFPSTKLLYFTEGLYWESEQGTGQLWVANRLLTAISFSLRTASQPSPDLHKVLQQTYPYPFPIQL